ncbi:hypothetical protein PENSPDRAFT_209505 [Peniophora sp. CONT]|nr:hypothetical protein PENSPDRAFT_209505 [Peniophora sp. CONT]
MMVWRGLGSLWRIVVSTIVVSQVQLIVKTIRLPRMVLAVRDSAVRGLPNASLNTCPSTHRDDGADGECRSADSYDRQQLDILRHATKVDWTDKVFSGAIAARIQQGSNVGFRLVEPKSLHADVQVQG